MKVAKIVPLALFVLLAGIQAFAQETPQYEIEAGYSLLHFNPARKYTTPHNLNGGGFAFDYNLNSWLGLKADLKWYGATANAFNFSSPIYPPVVNPLGNSPIIPAGTYHASGGMFTYQFGPQFKYHGHRVQPWAHTLFGGSKTDLWSNLLKQTNYSGYNSKSVSGFAMTIGGGVDVILNHLVTIRPMEFSYVMTRLNTPLLTLIGGISNQNDWRYEAGVVFTLGSHK